VISVIRNGETVKTVVTSSDAMTENPAINLTGYDPAVATALTAHKQDICLDGGNAVTSCAGAGVARRFRFVNSGLLRRKLTQGHREVATTTENPLSTANPTFGLGLGLCSLQDPGPPALDGQYPFTIDLNKGDTIIVEAERGAAAPPGLPVSGNIDNQVSVAASLSIDGKSVTVNGVTGTTNQPGAGLKFTFTTR
jgi:hypothetical protein